MRGEISKACPQLTTGQVDVWVRLLMLMLDAGDSGVERWGRHGHACTSQQGSLMPGQGVALMASSPSIPGLSSCHAVLVSRAHADIC